MKQGSKLPEPRHTHATVIFREPIRNTTNVWDVVVRTGWAVLQLSMRDWATTDPIAEFGSGLANMAIVGRL